MIRPSDLVAIEAIWAERRERVGTEPIYVVAYRAPDGERVHDWFSYSDIAGAAASRLPHARIREAPR